MPENTSTNPTPGAETPAANTTTSPEPTTTRSPGPWNKAQLAEMSKSERLGLAAQQTKYGAALTRQQILPEQLTQYLVSITSTRNQTATVGEANANADGASLSEADAKKLLVADIRKVQAIAKRRHARKTPQELPKYLVGTNVTESRPAMEQGSQTILNKLESDRLGLDTQFVTNMTDHRKAYVGGNVTQGSSEADAQANRLARDAQIESIKDFRIEIQYAIDAEYGPGDPANAPVRREFDLPVNRPFNAVKRKSA